MTEESSAGEDAGEADEDARKADEQPDQQRADEERSGDSEERDDDLAPARSEEEPDVEAAKAELEAVGEADEEGHDAEAAADSGESETSDAVPPTDEEEREPASADESTDDASATDPTEGDDGVDEDAEDGPNPEDLVRDPDEPQVTSSLDEREQEENAAAAADAGATQPAGESDAESGDESDATADDTDATSDESDAEPDHQPGVPDDVQKYDRFKKVDGSQYDRVNEFLRDRTYITAREWAIARLCSDFRTETGVEMTKIGENLPELVPFMTDTYTPQAVNQARSSFEDKVRTAGATFLYGAMCDFFTAEELDDVMYESTEVAKFLLEVEGVELSVEDELEAEDRISAVMREVRSSSAELRHERCPDCGAELSGGEH